MATLTLRVWAHWIAAPGAPAGAPTARPASLAGYAGTTTQLSVSGAAPQFVQKWAISPVVAVWAELAKQNHIDSANWGGAGWPGGPPDAWPPPPAPPAPPVNGDEGYSAAAVAFRVTGVSVIMRVTNNEFTFTIRDPANNIVGTVTPTSPASAPGVYPVTVPPGGGAIVPVPDGKGIWTVEITRSIGSAVSEPALNLGGPPGNLVQPTYVSPYGTLEGILGLAFDGEEVICPTVKTLTAEVEVQTAGGPVWQARSSLTGANYVDIGQKVRLTATYANPPPLAGTNYEWNFGDGPTANTQHPVSSLEHAYAAAGSYLCLRGAVDADGGRPGRGALARRARCGGAGPGQRAREQPVRRDPRGAARAPAPRRARGTRALARSSG